MKTTTCLLVAALGLAAAPAAPASPAYELVWQDEFDGGSLDLSKWQPQVGDGCPSLCGWGNNELQYYRAQNATVSDGYLTITAKQESFGGRGFTSARLRTLGLGDWSYGRFEMRAKLPVGQGLWPAFWMLPSDNAYGGWAASGEIDIMEYLGQHPDEVLGTIHYGGSWPGNTFSTRDYRLPTGGFDDGFHIFAIEWEPYVMRWYVDDVLFATQTDWWSGGGAYPAPFDQDFHLLLNMAVGGNLPGPPDASTQFPQEYVVDHVRVYAPAASEACRAGFDDMEHGDPFGHGWFAFDGSVGGGGISAVAGNTPPGGGSWALSSGWGSGGTPGFMGGFGRRRPQDLGGMTHLRLWIDPDAGQSYTLEINLQDDDNGDTAIPAPDGADDEFQYNFTVGGPGSDAIAGGGWQRVDIALSSFFDDNSYHYGGNGVLDTNAPGEGGNGLLVNIVTAVIGSGSDASFRTDGWEFVRRSASVAGRVWEDQDGDGTVDAGEAGLPGIDLACTELATGLVVATTTTAADGSYAFAGLVPGDHRVELLAGELPPGMQPTHDPDGTATAGRFDRALGCDEAFAAGDLGYRDPATAAPPQRALARLGQNVPNPFNPATTIHFELDRAARVELTVHDSAGRRVATLESATFPAGRHASRWDGADDRGRPVAGGVYSYRLLGEGFEEWRRMILLK